MYVLGEHTRSPVRERRGDDDFSTGMRGEFHLQAAEERREQLTTALRRDSGEVLVVRDRLANWSPPTRCAADRRATRLQHLPGMGRAVSTGGIGCRIPKRFTRCAQSGCSIRNPSPRNQSQPAITGCQCNFRSSFPPITKSQRATRCRCWKSFSPTAAWKRRTPAVRSHRGRRWRAQRLPPAIACALQRGTLPLRLTTLGKELRGEEAASPRVWLGLGRDCCLLYDADAATPPAGSEPGATNARRSRTW